MFFVIYTLHKRHLLCLLHDDNFMQVTASLCAMLQFAFPIPCGRSWFSPGTLVSSTNKTDQHDIPGIALKVALNTITLTHFPFLIVVAQNWIIFVVLRVSILPLCTLLIFDFGIVPTAW
jgi:hypothetical protein